ncbi:MAG: hypothetical protein QM770_05940 [Tepidisphaeraceae bacterium]
MKAQAMALAKQLMSEIVQCRYADPDTDSGETRSTYDDVSDYNGLVESPPTDQTGTALPGYTGWTRRVTVRLVTLASPSTTSVTDVGLKEITVALSSPTGRLFTLTSLRSSNDGYERASVLAGTYTSSIDVTLSSRDGDSTVTTSANTVNLVP